jgi:phosphomannomutase
MTRDERLMVREDMIRERDALNAAIAMLTLAIHSGAITDPPVTEIPDAPQSANGQLPQPVETAKKSANDKT